MIAVFLSVCLSVCLSMSVCLSVCLSVFQFEFSLVTTHCFFVIFCIMVDNCKIRKLADQFFAKIHLIPKWAKSAQSGQKSGFLNFSKNSVITLFWIQCCMKVHIIGFVPPKM